MPQFVPHCPLKNEKGLRQHPFTINHYSLYNSPIGFYGNDSPAGVPWLPVHLKEAGELQRKETGLCSTQHSSCTALPALDTLLGPAKRELHPLRQGKQPFCTGSLHRGKVPNFYSSILNQHCWKEAASTSQGWPHTPAHCPTALNIPVRGQVLQRRRQ